VCGRVGLASQEEGHGWEEGRGPGTYGHCGLIRLGEAHQASAGAACCPWVRAHGSLGWHTGVLRAACSREKGDESVMRIMSKILTDSCQRGQEGCFGRFEAKSEVRWVGGGETVNVVYISSCAINNQVCRMNTSVWLGKVIRRAKRYECDCSDYSADHGLGLRIL
jgi:hypothetical protein